MKNWTIAFAFLATLVGLSTVARAGMDPFNHAMGSVATQLVVISDALAADKTDGVKEAAEAIVKLVPTLSPEKSTSAHAGHYKMIPAQVLKGAEQLAKANTLKEARAGFKVLSAPVVMWAKMAKPDGLYVLYCGMQKASWLQKNDTVRNPYHGSEMLGCGEVQSRPASAKETKKPTDPHSHHGHH
jgi:hypothetical protein